MVGATEDEVITAISNQRSVAAIIAENAIIPWIAFQYRIVAATTKDRVIAGIPSQQAIVTAISEKGIVATTTKGRYVPPFSAIDRIVSIITATIVKIVLTAKKLRRYRRHLSCCS
ncbi:MAG: hypothetical protein AAFY02_15730 [Pseudomonadota bacterium]